MNTTIFHTEAGLALFLLFLCSLIIYLLFVLLILIKFRRSKAGTASTLRKISLLISAKNEEKNIPRLLKSLSEQNYPPENFEIIIVDDNSTDKTFDFAKSLTLPNCKVIDSKNKRYPGKKGALDVAINNASFKYIAITDADCFPEPDWMQSINLIFDRGYDIACGAVLFENIEKSVQKYSAFEQYRNLMLVHTLANAGMPYSASGGNFAFTREIFEKSGGYAATLQTASGDDDLLLQNALEHNAKVGSMLGKGTFTYTDAPGSYSEHFNRKRRHVSTSLYYNNKSKVILGAWYISSILLTLSFLLILNPYFFVFPFIKVITELLLFSRIKKVFNVSHQTLDIILNSIRFDIFTVFTFISQFFVKTKWKEN